MIPTMTTSLRWATTFGMLCVSGASSPGAAATEEASIAPSLRGGPGSGSGSDGEDRRLGFFSPFDEVSDPGDGLAAFPAKDLSSADALPVDDDYSFPVTEAVARIVNGDRATKDRYPYYTSLYVESWFGPPQHICGGSLITRDLVLSAAHCYSPSNRPTSVRVGAYSDADYRGTNGGQETYHDSEVLGYVIHPKYNTNSLNYDFLILKIEPVNDAQLIEGMVQIDWNGDVTRNLEGADSLQAIGLGRTETNGPLAEYLQEADLNYVDRCSRYFWGNTITNQMMCAADTREGQDSCQGDSGGPLLALGNRPGQDVQVGIVSWGMGGCASGKPGVYAKVSSVTDWIKDKMCKNSAYPVAGVCDGVTGGGGSNSGGGGGGGGGRPPTPRPPPPTPAPPPECTECWWVFCWRVAC